MSILKQNHQQKSCQATYWQPLRILQLENTQINLEVDLNWLRELLGPAANCKTNIKYDCFS